MKDVPTRRVAIAIFAVLTVGLLSVVPFATQAHAAASPWYEVYLHTPNGNGCVSYSGSESPGSKVISEPCSSSVWWQFRDINRDVVTAQDIHDGDQLEFVTQDFREAIYWSPTGGWELNTPNDNSTTVQMVTTAVASGDSWEFLGDRNFQVGMYPKAAGVQLGAPSSSGTITAPPDEWMECPLSHPICTDQTGGGGGILV